MKTKLSSFSYMLLVRSRIGDTAEIVLENCTIKATKTVKLLGVTIDKGLTFSTHIEETVRKCNGLLGVLAKASPFLPSELLRMAYVALIRSQLEYSNAVWSSASGTHLRRLDTVQKKASRIISHAPRGSHSEPLLAALNLDSLANRRSKHLIKIVESCAMDTYHPALNSLFNFDAGSNMLAINAEGRIGIGKRRFEIYARNLYNEHLARN